MWKYFLPNTKSVEPISFLQDKKPENAVMM